MEDINVRSFSTEIEPVKREIRLLNERNDYLGILLQNSIYLYFVSFIWINKYKRWRESKRKETLKFNKLYAEKRTTKA